MTTVQPTDRVASVLSTVRVADAIQDVDFRATQLIKGQDYFAHILSKIDDRTFMVKVEGSLLKMELGTSANVGQAMLLKYINDVPSPTFMLIQQNVTAPKGEATLSPAGKWIDQQLKEAEKQGVTARYVADDVVTNTPKAPQLVASELRQALSQTGLFYESHLKDFTEGQRTLQAVLQEPQNQPNTSTTALLAQQLAVLENQRLMWRGEIWPGQVMDWEVQVHDDEKEQSKSGTANNQQDMPPVSSEITLHMPRLGKVSARIMVMNDQIRINLSADSTETVSKMKAQSMYLSSAMERNGQKIEALTVSADE